MNVQEPSMEVRGNSHFTSTELHQGTLLRTENRPVQLSTITELKGHPVSTQTGGGEINDNEYLLTSHLKNLH